MRMGLVMLPKPPNTPEDAACSHVPASCSEAMISEATVPKSVPRPVIPAVKLPCRDTQSLYSSTGTVVNRLTAINPLMAFKALSFTLPRPVWYSMPHSKADTTRPVA